MKREIIFEGEREGNKPEEKQMMQKKNNCSSPTKQCPTSAQAAIPGQISH